MWIRSQKKGIIFKNDCPSLKKSLETSLQLMPIPCHLKIDKLGVWLELVFSMVLLFQVSHVSPNSRSRHRPFLYQDHPYHLVTWYYPSHVSRPWLPAQHFLIPIPLNCVGLFPWYCVLYYAICSLRTVEILVLLTITCQHEMNEWIEWMNEMNIWLKKNKYMYWVERYRE